MKVTQFVWSTSKSLRIKFSRSSFTACSSYKTVPWLTNTPDPITLDEGPAMISRSYLKFWKYEVWGNNLKFFFKVIGSNWIYLASDYIDPIRKKYAWSQFKIVAKVMEIRNNILNFILDLTIPRIITNWKEVIQVTSSSLAFIKSLTLEEREEQTLLAIKLRITNRKQSDFQHGKWVKQTLLPMELKITNWKQVNSTYWTLTKFLIYGQWVEYTFPPVKLRKEVTSSASALTKTFNVWTIIGADNSSDEIENYQLEVTLQDLFSFWNSQAGFLGLF